MSKQKLELKPLFVERMQQILTNKEDFDKYLEYLKNPAKDSIRVNTLKISPEDLKKRLEKKGWKIKQPFSSHPEIFIIESDLAPGEIGRSLEHLLGYYYVQEIASMLPIIAINPNSNEKILDLCASPGSKTTQLASYMKNKGLIVANEISLGRIRILSSNLGRCGVTNTLVTMKNGVHLCEGFYKNKIFFDKILVDAPCSGEGTLRSSPKTALMWNAKTLKMFSKIQKHLVESSLKILKPNGILIYSTCTHSPEENEEVVDYLLKNYPVKIEKVSLPKELKFREGITNWKDKDYDKQVKNCCRIYPQDNNTEGFFITKIIKIK